MFKAIEKCFSQCKTHWGKSCLAALLVAMSWQSTAQTITFIDSLPIVDGKRDSSLETLPRHHFSHVYDFDNVFSADSGEKSLTVTYSLGYHQQGLYVLIETNAPKISYHKRGFVYGDGFKLILGKATPFGRSQEYIELAYSPAQDKSGKALTQYVSSYNFNQTGRRLSELSSMRESTTSQGTAFEAFIHWDDIAPYHPAFSKTLGVNLYFAKGLPDTQGNHVTKGYAVVPDDGFWEESQSFRKLSEFEFELPDRAISALAPTYTFSHRTIFAGQALGIRAPFVNANTRLNWRVSGPNQASVLEASTPYNGDSLAIPTESLTAGTYSLELQTGAQRFSRTFTILPNLALEQRFMQLIASGNVDEGDINALLFQLQSLQDRLLALKPYETATSLADDMHAVSLAVADGIMGQRPFYKGNTLYRRAFRSMLDGSLQPYSIRLPENYSPDKTYPLLVFLHGSGQDEQALLNQQRGNGEYIELAPLGRDMFNAYALKQSDIDIEEAINDAIRHYSIDQDNIVIGGFSMGGYGALITYHRNPAKYRAVAVFAGHPNLANQWLDTDVFPNFTLQENVEVFKGVPVFVYHGTDDPAVPYPLMRQFAADAETAGANVTTSFVGGRGHVYQDAATHTKWKKWLQTIVSH